MFGMVSVLLAFEFAPLPAPILQLHDRRVSQLRDAPSVLRDELHPRRIPAALRLDGTVEPTAFASSVHASSFAIPKIRSIMLWHIAQQSERSV
jgi:hypothetical protein